METETKLRQVVFVPLPAMGHILPMLKLAKELRQHGGHRLAVTFFLVPPFRSSPDVSSFVSTLPSAFPSFSFHHLPALAIPPHTRPQAVFPVALDLCKPLIGAALRTLLLRSPISAVVLDFLFGNMIDPCLELGVPPYVFFTCSASVLALMLHLPKLEERDGVPFPAFASKVPFSSMPEMYVHGKKDEAFELFANCGDRFRRAKGILVNTFQALQREVLEALEEGVYGPAPPVLAVGPVLSLANGEEKGHECIRWLDRQPTGSVVFLCFGSRESFGREQARELAVGLERSGRRFLWVLRAPPLDPYACGIRDAELEELLPEGFVERTEERGLVWPSFVPQREVLRHPAVGGFVTHCGWNSTLEGLWSGVPMAAWPLGAEQHWNAREMAAETGVAMEVAVERWKGNWVPAAEVERAVRLLMGEGNAGISGKKKVEEMKAEARKAVAEGGSSYRALGRLAAEWAGGDQSREW